MKDITSEEMTYLVNSVINTARYLGKEINLDDITTEYLERELKLYRIINDKFNKLLKNAVDVNCSPLIKQA